MDIQIVQVKKLRKFPLNLKDVWSEWFVSLISFPFQTIIFCFWV